MNAAASANVARLTADAAALVRAASPRDWPGGFRVIPERLPRGIVALACGAGAGVAALYRFRPGVCGVLVDPGKLVADLAAPTLAETTAFESVTLHEAAHTLVAVDAAPDTVDTLLSTAGPDVAAYAPEQVARQHNPRWAMAWWILTDRAARYRRTGAIMRDHAAASLGLYGFARADLEQMARGVEPDEPLRARLAAGGLWDTLLSARLPDEHTRAGAIVAAGLARGAETEGTTNGCRG